MRKNNYKILSLLMCASLMMSCSANTNTSDSTNENNESSKVELNIKTLSDKLVEYEDNDFYTKWENENPNYINLNSTSAEIIGSGAIINENIITINSPGTYVVSGKLDNGQIIVDSSSDDSIKLVLNNAEINCQENAPIYIKDSGKTIISLVENSINSVTDGSVYNLADETTDEPDAAIFSKSDLTINGLGTLTVNANYNNGIAGKDDLKITSGNININSIDDGLIGKDLLAIKDVNLTIDSQGDSIKATNDTDEEKGNIVLENGSFVLKAGSDGIQAERTITIIDGNYTINSISDSLHSNNSIEISGGTFYITSEDDAIHADSTIDISGGTINILKSYEGIESATINISDGNIQIASSDDGINISSGDDASSVNGMPENSTRHSSGNDNLNISGGTIYVNASGDGLDANGSVYMSGGTVIICGPESNGNGAIDYDQKFEVTGGLLIASGSSGMAQSPSDSSTQNSVQITYSQVQKAGTIVNLANADGNNIITFAPDKNYQSIIISSPELKLDSTYTLYSGGTSTGVKNNGLFTGGDYENGTILTDLVISKSVLSISDTGEEVTIRSFMPGQGPGGRNSNGGGMKPDIDNMQKDNMPKFKEGDMPEFPEGEMPELQNGTPTEKSL